MKIIFFNRCFFPDSSATSQILSDLAFHLAATGACVHVVTTSGPEARNAEEIISGVHVHRVAYESRAQHGLKRKAAAHLRFLLAARSAARRLVARGDVVVLKTDPPMLPAALAPCVSRAGARTIVWVQDLFPEIAEHYGILGPNRPPALVLRWWRDRALRIADKIIAIGDRMGEYLSAHESTTHARLAVIHNWADGSRIAPLDPEASILRRAWGLRQQFVVGYSGSLGRLHEFDTLADAAFRLKDHHDVSFLIVGDGPRLAALQARVLELGLRSFQFQPRQTREVLSDSLGASDVHICSLRSEYEGLALPSKLYGIMAAGRPTIFVGDPSGETSKILARANAGISVRTSDGARLAEAILRCKNNPGYRFGMSANARRDFEANYDMRLAVRKWESLLSPCAI